MYSGGSSSRIAGVVLYSHQPNMPAPLATADQGLVKQSSLDDPFDNTNEADDGALEIESLRMGADGSDDELPPTPPRPSTPAPAANKLPWTPKVR